jgi:hypothetical protein
MIYLTVFKLGLWKPRGWQSFMSKHVGVTKDCNTVYIICPYK